MSVMIKGMEMPRGCNVCQLRDLCFDYYICRAKKLDDGRYLDVDDVVDRRHRYCPLIDIPTPHGRLIDAEKAAHSILMMSSHPCGCSIENVKDVVEWLRFVNGDGNNFAFPTIIEAEVSE